MPVQQHQFLKIGNASKALGVSESSLRKWSDSGLVRAIRTPGGQRLVDMSSVDGFLVSTAQGEGVRARVLYARVSSAKQRNDLER